MVLVWTLLGLGCLEILEGDFDKAVNTRNLKMRDVDERSILRKNGKLCEVILRI